MKTVGLIWILIFGAFAALGQKSDSALSRKLVAPWWVEKFRVSAGFFVPVSSTKIQVSANGYIDGTNIDLNKDLGYNADIATFITSFQWRISRRSRLTLGYFNMQRSTTHKLQKDIIFDSTTYPANTVVNSYFNTTIYQFSYGYAIVEKPDYEIGIQIGTHAVESKVGITSNGYSAGATISNNFGVSAPLPDLGIWGGFAFSKRLAANLDWVTSRLPSTIFQGGYLPIIW